MQPGRPGELQGIDVLLTDLVMPRLDGLSVLEAARVAAPNAVPIVLTSFGDKDRVIAASTSAPTT